jgi:hypothetical protein
MQCSSCRAATTLRVGGAPDAGGCVWLPLGLVLTFFAVYNDAFILAAIALASCCLLLGFAYLRSRRYTSAIACTACWRCGELSLVESSVGIS